MNSVKYIVSHVDSLLDHVAGPGDAARARRNSNEPAAALARRAAQAPPPQPRAPPTLWTILVCIVLLQWGSLAEFVQHGSYLSEPEYVIERAPAGAAGERRRRRSSSLSGPRTPGGSRNGSRASSRSSSPSGTGPSTPGGTTSATTVSSATADSGSRKRSKNSPGPSRGRAGARTSTSLLKSPFLWRDSERKTLVLDLDETLIHSMSRAHSFGASHMVEVELQNQLKCMYFVDKRPYCDYFLSTVAQWFNVVIFTASVQSYADPMIDWLEQGGQHRFARRLYRTDCIATAAGYVKDLNVVTGELGRVLLIDNSPVSYSLQHNNGIGIEGWISDPSDSALLHLLPLLNALRGTTDVRSILCLQDGEAFREAL